MSIRKRDLKSANAWRTEGDRILWLREEGEEFELYVAQPASGTEPDRLYTWLTTYLNDDGLPRHTCVGPAYDLLEEVIGHENLLTADILDADPHYAEQICALATTVAREDVSWDLPSGSGWSWAWRRSLNYGVAVPVHLIESKTGEKPTKKQLLERLRGWHAAIQDMMRLRVKFVHPTASAVPVVEQTDMSSLAIARSEH